MSLTYGRPEYVYEGHDNALWIGTNAGGISRLDLETYQFQSWRQVFDDSNSLGGNIIGGILDAGDGIVWVGSDDFCLSRLDWRNGTVQRFYPPADQESRRRSNYLGHIAQGRDPSILWIGAPFGVYRFDKQTAHFELIRFRAFDRPYVPSPVPVFVDEEGVVWSGSVTGIVRIDPSGPSFKELVLKRKNDQPGEIWQVTDIKPYGKDQLILTTLFDGLIILDTHTLTWHRINDDPGLAPGARFFLRDETGNIWIGSSGPLLRATQESPVFQHISLSHLPGNNWNRAYLPDGDRNALYVGTLFGAGLLHIDFESQHVRAFRFHVDPVTGTDVYYRDLAQHPDTRIYMATDSGLLYFDPGLEMIGRVRPDRAEHRWDDITTVCVCDSTIWFASMTEGLFGIRRSPGHPHIHERVLPGRAINDLHCDGPALWIGTNSGLLHLDHPAADGNARVIIPDVHVREIVRSSAGQFWIGTFGQGLFELVSQDTDSAIAHFNEMGGGTNMIYALAAARDGLIWLNTEAGTLSLDPATGQFSSYPEMGVVQRSSITELPNGAIVNGRNRHIMFFNADELSERGVAPRPYITAINIANRHEQFDQVADRIGHITLAPHEREVVIEFDAINFNEPATTDFQYRVRGLDDTWRRPGEQRYISLNNLRAGDYTLELKAINAYGGQSSHYKSLRIEVTPLLHQRWWFRIALLVVIAAAATAAYRFLQNRVRRREEAERKERVLLGVQKEIAESKLTALQAQMNPHFIFNSLNSINWYILKNKQAEASLYLTKFSKLVRLILDNSRDLSIPLDRELEALRLYLDLEAMRFDHKFEFEIQTDDEIDLEEVMIPPLILQPFVENAIWHGLMHKEDRGHLLIQIYPENGHLKCIVQDNGIGRRAAQQMKLQSRDPHESKGMKLTTDRVKLLHQNYLKEDMIRIIDLVNDRGEAAGTRVEVILPDK